MGCLNRLDFSPKPTRHAGSSWLLDSNTKWLSIATALEKKKDLSLVLNPPYHSKQVLDCIVASGKLGYTNLLCNMHYNIKKPLYYITLILMLENI